MTEHDIVRLLAGLALCGAVVFGTTGCANDRQSRMPETDNPSYSTVPYANAPRLDVSWRLEIATPGFWSYQPVEFSNPHLSDGPEGREVFVGSDAGVLSRVKAFTGETEWDARLEAPIHATPVATDDSVFVGTLHGTFHSVDRESGDINWTSEAEYAISSPAAVSEGRVYFATGSDTLFAVDAATGEEIWDYSRPTPERFTTKGTGTPVVRNGALYIGFSDGTLGSFDAVTGQTNWTTDLSGGNDEFVDVDAPPVVRGDRLYAVSYGVGIYALNRETGELIWMKPISNVASIQVGDGMVYATQASGRVLGLFADSGDAKWSYRMNENLPVELAVGGPYAFVSTASGPIYVIDRQEGYPLVKWDPSNGFNTQAVFSQKAGYVLSNRGYLYRFTIAF